MIERGHVQLDASAALLPSRKVRLGQVLRLDSAANGGSRAFVPIAMALDIVFEDEHLLVLDKPARLGEVTPAPGNWSSTLLNGLRPVTRTPPLCRVPASCTVWTRTRPD